jgi:hemoglobin
VTIPLRPSSGQGVGPEAPSGYDRMGGHDTFVRLVAAFYGGVASDGPLRALYPEEDLAPAAERLTMFLEQYFGGPNTYSEKRGHPRLRMRHAEFAVTPAQRDRWLTHMLAACDEIALPEAEDAELRSYLTNAADFMVNAED